MKKVLQKLEGSWRIESSSGEASDGHVFRVGQRVDVKGDTLSFPAGTTDRGELRKTIRVVLRASGPTAIDLDHRGDFLPTEKPGDDAAARRSPNSKGWSRRAIVRVDGNKMTLALEFPQNARPTDFNPNKATVEVVVLSRIP